MSAHSIARRRQLRLDQLRSAIERIQLEGLVEFSKRIAVV